MTKLQKNKELKQNKILDAAQNLFLSQGYIATSMDLVAKESGVTKQTLYRYFESKIVLFEAALKRISENQELNFERHLLQQDIEKALTDFAIDCIEFHVSELHVQTFRLLISENKQAPEIMNIFMVSGPDKTDVALNSYFKKQLKIKNPKLIIELWFGMLLAPRTSVLMGMDAPSKSEIKKIAKESVAMILK